MTCQCRCTREVGEVGEVPGKPRRRRRGAGPSGSVTWRPERQWAAGRRLEWHTGQSPADPGQRDPNRGGLGSKAPAANLKESLR